MSAVEGAKELAAKLEGKPLDEIFKEETLNKLRYVQNKILIALIMTFKKAIFFLKKTYTVLLF